MLTVALCVLAATLAWCYRAPADEIKTVASFYSKGKRVACGGRFNPDGLTAAHPKLPCGTKLEVRFRGKSVVVVVNDKGPFVRGRGLDLSRGAARALGFTGVRTVTYRVLQKKTEAPPLTSFGARFRGCIPWLENCTGIE